ncbi:unnamed protein product [Rotaria socialis]
MVGGVLANFAYTMQAALVRLYYKYSIYRAGHKKHLLPIENDGFTASFSYTEKGSRSREKPSIVFVHGVSSNKEAWIPIIKNIRADHHCITVDLPGHGETVGFNEDVYSIDKFVEKLKLFFDQMELIEPMCIVGASMGASVVGMFAVKYPNYVKMLCLLAPIGNEESETDLIRQLRTGVYNTLLPETPEEFHHMIYVLTTTRPSFPRVFVNGFLHLSLQLIKEHKKVIASLFENEYPQLEQHYEKLRQLNCPVLILWGRQDQVYAFTAAEYFSNLISNSECIILEDCGHVMAIDKPEDTARSILAFYDSHVNHNIKFLH